MKRWKYKYLTLASDGDTGNAFKDLLASSSDEQSEHKKWSNFFASSMVIPMQEGWNLQGIVITSSKQLCVYKGHTHKDMWPESEDRQDRRMQHYDVQDEPHGNY